MSVQGVNLSFIAGLFHVETYQKNYGNDCEARYTLLAEQKLSFS